MLRMFEGLSISPRISSTVLSIDKNKGEVGFSNLANLSSQGLETHKLTLFTSFQRHHEGFEGSLASARVFFSTTVAS